MNHPILSSAAAVCFAVFLPGTAALAQTDPADLNATQRGLVAEHVRGGLPTDQPILVRQGYVALYDAEYRVPVWVAYHVTPEYLQTPQRRGRFSSFRTDPDIANPVIDDDYNGLFDSRGYARGHLAPYAVMGGDRDNDGRLAADDDDDARTIFEANYMTNITPQHHDAFNGSGGLWFQLERWVQDVLVEQRELDVWIHAGSILGPGEHEVVGPDEDIFVPAMFYKIVVLEDDPNPEPVVLAFLFPHQREAHGDIQHFLVSIDLIEALSGLDFFTEMDDDTELWFEDVDTWANWERVAQPGP